MARLSNEIQLDLVKNHATRFWSSVNCGEPNACWLWNKYADEYGYGDFVVGRHPAYKRNLKIAAHRVAFMLSYNQAPDVVRHTCDNPSCCNPKHLIGGSHADNVRDRVERGRSAVGVKNGRAKLTEDQVREIRNSTKPKMALARDYGVNQKVIFDIKRKNTWRHIS